MLAESGARAILESAVAASTAGQTEVYLLAENRRLTRFANNGIHQNVAESNVTVAVRAVVDHRVGIVRGNDLRPESVQRMLETAVNLARLRPEDPDFPGLPLPQPCPPAPGFDEAAAACSPETRAQAVADICQRAGAAGLVAAGAFETSVVELAVANSQGLFAYHPLTQVDLQTVVMSADSSGWAQATAWRLDGVDPMAIGAEALRKAQMGREPRELPPGEYAVVLDPYCTQDLLNHLSVPGLGAQWVQEQQSWLNGRLGQPVMSSSVSIWDDPRAPDSLPVPFDGEGVPCQRVELVQAGVPVGPVYDTRTAAREPGRQSTGHALPPLAGARWWGSLGPLPSHLGMAAGDSSVAEMIAGTERGLYITRFNYTRMVHPREVIVTGLTRDGTFVIERGEIAYPIRNLRFTQSYLTALAQVEALSQERRLLRTNLGASLVPALKLSAFRFTGGKGS